MAKLGRSSAEIGAVVKQTATTNEMGRNVSEAACGSGGTATRIGAIASAARDSTTVAGAMSTALDELEVMSQDLRTKVAFFSV